METETETETEVEIIRWFEEVAADAGRTQTETLRRILEENCGVEYLRRYLGGGGKEISSSSSSVLLGLGLGSSNKLEEVYRRVVPLSSHSDFEPFIQRIADGDETNSFSSSSSHHHHHHHPAAAAAALLTLNPITALSLSSGTTDGRQKLVPFTRHTTLTTFQIFSLAAAYRSRVYPLREGKRALQLIYSSKQYKTKGGLTVGTATTHIYASEEFKTQTNHLSCSPQEVISSGDYRQSTYCHLLLGLFFSHDVDYITSPFAYSIVQALASFEDLYPEICHDIRFGTLSPRITLPAVRKAVLQIIRPDPALASRIHLASRDLRRLNWAGIIPTLWPCAKYVCSIMTGSMQPYTKKLRHYAGGLPLVSADYGSTESWIGVNVDPSLPPEEVTFAVVPSFSYFEFIPVHKPKPDCTSMTSISDHNHLIEDDPVTLSQVKLGQQYELVLTTFTGLYRYRLGDIVEVSGFHKGTPKLSFVCRRNLILTINIDKNTEKDLQLVVERASQVLSLSPSGGELVDFTSHAVAAADVGEGNEQGHYVVYWEIKGDVEDRVLEECCGEMDRSFVDHGYVVSRRCGSIGPLELRVVEGGTFKKILDYFVEKGGASLSQFKTPRCTSNSVLLSILNAATTKTFYSTAYI